jgi:3-oxoacyl-[acyl-carrier protein] reductase
MNLSGKTALVTGASRGIGKAIALRLAQSGADLAVVSRSLDSLQATIAAVQALGRKAQGYAVDVADSEAVARTADQILKDFPQIDILVNNAGVTRDGLLMRMSEEDWNIVINTNLKGAFNWTKPIGRAMVRQRSGRIINIASVIGLIGNAGQANYAASKAGLIGFSKSVAREFAGRGITCNVVCPGFIETDMTGVLPEETKKKVLELIPLQRFGQGDDIAAMVDFLAGAQAAYITGQVLAVDGGMTI